MTRILSASPQLLANTARRVTTYLDGLQDRSVAAAPDALAAIGAFDTPLDAGGIDAEAVIAQLDAIGSPASMAMAGPRFFGFVIGGALPVSVAANWLATGWDQNSSLYNVTPATALLEQVALRWLVELLGLPAGCAGAFVSGATMGNFVALAAARHAQLQRAGWNVETDGLFGAPPLRVIVGEEVHPSLLKALGMLGLGRTRVERVPADGQGRLRAEKLPPLDASCIVCAQAGNVNTGASDPFEAIAAATRAAGAWLHVDGAFGLWAAAAPRRAALVRGIGEADSWATDAHKWLNVPYDSGLAFVRHDEALRAAMAVTAEYLPTATAQRNPCDYTPEISRRARGVDVWATLRHLGRDGVAELIERNCRQAARFAAGLRDAGYRVLNEVVLNQVLVSFGDAAATRSVIAALQAEGTCWCGITVWQGETAMRISVSSWATRDEDVELSLAAIDRVAKSVIATRT